MNPQKEREDRWLAYYLGELPESERRAVEEEFEADPALAADMKDFLRDVETWAKRPVPGEPMDIDAVRQHEAPGRGGFKALRWPLSFAAAALFLFALTQVQFSLEFGDTQFAWGQAPSAVNTGLPELQARLDAMEAAQASTQAAVETVAMQTVVLEENLNTTAATLAAAQQQETIARYRDMEQLLAFAASTDELGFAW